MTEIRLSSKWILQEIAQAEKQMKDWEGTLEPENALVYRGRIEAYRKILKHDEELGKIYEDMYWQGGGR